jgi:transglutaminase-like putative cysteine protease
MSALTQRERGPGAAFAVLLCAIAGAAHFASFAMLAARTPEGEPPTKWLMAALGLMGLSFGLQALTRRARRSPVWRTLALLSLLGQVWLLVVLGQLAAVAAMTGFVLVLQGALLSRAADPAPAVLALALSTVQALLALGAEPGAITLVAFLITAGLSPAAAVLLHAERARGRTLVSRRPAAPPRMGVRDVARRLRYALIVSGLGAVPAIALLAFFSLLSRSGWKVGSSVEEEAVAAADIGGPDERFLSAHMGFGAGEGRTSNDPVAWVRLRDGETGELVRDGRPLWLKSMTPDTFTEDALRQLDIADLQLHVDADDGRADGWVRLPEGTRTVPGAADERVLELQVHQSPLRVIGSGGDVLLYGEPPLAVEVPSLRYHPDRAMVSAQHSGDWFGYRVRTTEAGLSARRALGSGRAAAHPDPRFVQLPDPSPALERVDREVRAMVLGAPTDEERVRRILASFHDEFEYSLEGSGFTGLESVVAFLDRRKGYCTAFASTTVLMLRRLGIPARGAVGYLVTEWDAGEADYIVRRRHAHAWIEVHFVDRGWVAFDPTPSAQRESLVRASAGDERPAGLRAWGAQLADEVRELALAQGQTGPDDVLRTLAAAPEALMASARRSPLVALAVVLAVCVFALLRLSRRTFRPGPLGVPLPPRSRAESFWDRLLLALEAHGFHKRRSQTPREFAAGVVAHGGPSFGPLATAAELLYRARWGEDDPSREERAVVAEFLRQLRR